MTADEVRDPIEGEGYAVANIDGLGEGPGFRKIRRGVGVTAFGINAVVMPPGYESGRHFHDEQEETYFVHRGTMEMEFGDGTIHRLGPGGVARVDPGTIRRMRNVGDDELVYVCAGGKDGYVGRDAHVPDPDEPRSRATPGGPAAPPGADASGASPASGA